VLQLHANAPSDQATVVARQPTPLAGVRHVVSGSFTARGLVRISADLQRTGGRTGTRSHGFGDVSDGPALTPDPVDQQPPTMNGETTVTLGPEYLRLVKTANSTPPGGLRLRPLVTKLMAGYIC
jgi:hypothetical protein